MASIARFDLKLDKDDKDLFAQAATLAGTSMAGFVRSAAKEKAQAIIDRESPADSVPAGFSRLERSARRSIRPE